MPIKKGNSMTATPRRAVLAAALLACATFAAQAQPAPPAPAAPGAAPMHDAARMQQHMQRRLAGLKRILQITPAQEGAWTAWAAAMQPSPQAMQQRRALHEELEHLTTPERIDRMRQLHAQRAAEMDKRGDATKTFYAQLTTAQQKAFDEVSLRFFEGRGRHGHRGHAMMGA
jgi:Spy/CpxP family protein refolding chaperone